MARTKSEGCMEAAELVAIGERAFGPWGWQRRMAQALDMNENTVRRWRTGAWPVNASMAARIRALDPSASCHKDDGRTEATGRAGLLMVALRAGASARLVRRGDETGLEAVDGSWTAWDTDGDSIRSALAMLGETQEVGASAHRIP